MEGVLIDLIKTNAYSSPSLSRADSIIAAGDFERQTYSIEIRCYERLGYHERIASCEVTEKGLLLERGTCLRSMLRDVSESAIPRVGE
ncbi:uncharacterized protein N7515_002598 [Penicillium bovifimosum]|uniref:Uncharacterized protein n=1 Tax=Penicillium bovifimosum TaxID=126998 RepID=A0A9W9HDP9_9EURO|nr:uncharacterized protein N7515_002598 [Penicillium bovifimosum]KAJ5143811.1 hypothetical protein N7515_002598 [Penicillium bovifimosum]